MGLTARAEVAGVDGERMALSPAKGSIEAKFTVEKRFEPCQCMHQTDMVDLWKLGCTKTENKNMAVCRMTRATTLLTKVQ